MIQETLMEYGQSTLMVIGLMELFKKLISKKLTHRQLILIQVSLCFVAGLLNGLTDWQDGFTAGLIVLVANKWGLLASITTLFYSLIIKKIRDAGGKIREE